MSRTLTALALAISLSPGALASSATDEPDRETLRPLEPTPEDLQQYRLAPPEPALVDGPGGSPLLQIAGWGMVAASAADLGTTEWGLSRGLSEANPVASHRGVRVLHHVVGPAAVWWTTERLHSQGRTKLAVTLRIALMAAYSYAAVHNARKVTITTP